MSLTKKKENDNSQKKHFSTQILKYFSSTPTSFGKLFSDWAKTKKGKITLFITITVSSVGLIIGAVNLLAALITIKLGCDNESFLKCVICLGKCETEIQLAHRLFDDNNLANLQIEIMPKVLSVDQTMKMNISSDNAGYLSIFQINSENKFFQIFTNDLCKKGYIKAGQTLIPERSEDGCEFYVKKPVGDEALIAVLTNQKFSFAQKIGMAEVLLPQLHQELDNIKQENNFEHSFSWSSTVIDYKTWNSIN